MTVKVRFLVQQLVEGTSDESADALFEQVYVDRARLREQIKRMLETRASVSLGEVVGVHPLEQGLAEIVAYLALAADSPLGRIDDTSRQVLRWRDDRDVDREASLPLVQFFR